jgi:FMN-dependent NADH-azoreductase
MNLLAIIGSPRKGKATDTLVDKAIEGIKAKEPDCNVKKINLVDYNIQYCKNCLVCRDADTNEPLSKCVIKDDMAQIYEELLESDALILGTPVHSGYPTALMMIFLERITWTFAKPEKRYLTIRGCPLPRSDKKRKSIIIITSGIISPLYRRFCDWATKCIRDNVRDSLNAKTVGDMYAGDIEHRGVDYYFDKANKLGQKLV